MTIIKKCGIILGWRAGYPQRLVDNLWISRFGTRRLRFCTTFPLWRRRITLTLVTFPLWRRKSLWLNLRQGVSLKINWRKKGEGVGFLAFAQNPLPSKVVCKSENLQFTFFEKFCFLAKSDLFSFWKTPLKSLSSISSCFPFKVYFLTWYNHYTDFPFYCKYYFKLIQ